MHIALSICIIPHETLCIQQRRPRIGPRRTRRLPATRGDTRTSTTPHRACLGGSLPDGYPRGVHTSAAAAALENSPRRKPWGRRAQARIGTPAGVTEAPRRLRVAWWCAESAMVHGALPTPLPGLPARCARLPMAYAMGYFPTPLPRLRTACDVRQPRPSNGIPRPHRPRADGAQDGKLPTHSAIARPHPPRADGSPRSRRPRPRRCAPAPPISFTIQASWMGSFARELRCAASPPSRAPSGRAVC
jgi:hypothetical protein